MEPEPEPPVYTPVEPKGSGRELRHGTFRVVGLVEFVWAVVQLCGVHAPWQKVGDYDIMPTHIVETNVELTANADCGANALADAGFSAYRASDDCEAMGRSFMGFAWLQLLAGLAMFAFGMRGPATKTMKPTWRQWASEMFQRTIRQSWFHAAVWGLLFAQLVAFGVCASDTRSVSDDVGKAVTEDAASGWAEVVNATIVAIVFITWSVWWGLWYCDAAVRGRDKYADGTFARFI